jgi:hemerythrin-like domain-containing protein
VTHALYYPTIEFRDVNSLKRALLCWERVFRIVPSTYVPNDCPEVAVAKQEGLVVDLLLDANEKRVAAHQFLDLYHRLDSPDNRLVWPAGLSTETYTRINPEKIDAKLLPLFEQLSQRLTADGFLEVSSELAGGYMFYLANAVAASRSLDLLSDSADYWTVGTFFASAANFTDAVYSETAEAYLATLAVEDLLPRDFDEVPIEKVLRFRAEHDQERVLFQEALKELRQQVSRCNSKQHAQYIVVDFVKHVERARDQYRDSMGFLRKTDINTLLTVGLPVGMGFLSLPTVPAGDPYSALRIGAGLLFGVVSSLASRSLIPKERSVSSYLVSTEAMASGPGYALHRKFEDFIND